MYLRFIFKRKVCWKEFGEIKPMEAYPILFKKWLTYVEKLYYLLKLLKKNQALYFDYLTDFTHSQYWNG